MDITTFMKHLHMYRAPRVFNPWREYEPGLDIGPEAPQIRYGNLQRYLELRCNAHYLFIAEGLGYQGGRFSGMAMTSERILLGHHPEV
ncbi:MAG: uracil-DNA glycosylase, partial [Acidaminococcaceae bacterium]|nr:uracil-DNA glycosylase [Acidaminococcaceae bacterium]